MQPMPVIPLEYEQPVTGAARIGRALRVLVIITWAVCAIAWGLIVTVDVHTVMVSGPVIAILGVMIILRGLIEHRSPFIVVGAAHLGICLLFVTLVNWRHWSPGDATNPFMVMGAIYVLGSGVGGGYVLLPAHLRRQWRAAARI